MYKLWPRQFSAFKEAICASLQPRSALVPEKKEAISALQPRSALVPGKKSGARQSATSVVAATAGSMTSSLSDGTYQRPGRSKSASPVHHGDAAGSMGKCGICSCSEGGCATAG